MPPTYFLRIGHTHGHRAFLLRSMLAGLCALLLLQTARAAGLRASDRAQGDQFGFSVSVYGNNALIGANLADSGMMGDVGRAYFFLNFPAASGITTETSQVSPFNGSAGDGFGTSLSLFGTAGLIGSPGRNSSMGSAYFVADVVTSPGTQVQLIASNGAAGDQFGASVSLLGTTALVGAYGHNGSRGEAYVFQNLSGSSPPPVTETVRLSAFDAAIGDEFGQSVSLSANGALVGAGGKNNSQGAAYFFTDLSTNAINPMTGTITQSVKLTATDGTAGDQFGKSVSLAGSTALIGAPGQSNQSATPSQGAAYYYSNAANNASQVVLTGFMGGIGDQFGTSVSLSGTTGLIGASGEVAARGAAYLVPDLTAPDTMVRLVASDGQGSSFFGGSVSLDGDNFVVGAYSADFASLPFAAGKAYNGSVSSVTTFDTGSTSRTIDGLSFISQTDWVIGSNTDSNQVSLLSGNSATVTTSGKAVFIGRNSGSDNNTLIVHGAVTATDVNISAASGSTGNSLQISNTGKVTATTVTVNNGGTLLFTGTNASMDRLGSSTAVTIASGGRLNTGGFSEGASTSGAPAGFGALTLQGGAAIDFMTGANGSTLLASSGVVTGAGTISIYNWTGTAAFDNGSGGNDRLLFVSNPMFSETQLAQFQFYNDSNVAFATGAMQIEYNGFYELVPVPEPSTWVAGALACGSIGAAFLRRRRLRRIFSPRH